jgi:hypothetical protein
VIGDSQSEARIGVIFRADPSLRLVTDYSPLGRRNSHYADGSGIRPRNGSPARIGLTQDLLAVSKTEITGSSELNPVLRIKKGQWVRSGVYYILY